MLNLLFGSLSHIFGCYEPFESIKITFFNGFKALHFVSFFIDHTVHCIGIDNEIHSCTNPINLSLHLPIYSYIVVNKTYLIAC